MFKKLITMPFMANRRNGKFTTVNRVQPLINTTPRAFFFSKNTSGNNEKSSKTVKKTDYLPYIALALGLGGFTMVNASEMNSENQ